MGIAPALGAAKTLCKNIIYERCTMTFINELFESNKRTRSIFSALTFITLVFLSLFVCTIANSQEEDDLLNEEWFTVDRLTTFKVKFDVINSKDDNTFLHVGVIRKGPLHIFASWEQSRKIEWPSGSTQIISLNDYNPMLRSDASNSYIGFCIYPTGNDTFEFVYTLTAWSTKSQKRVNLASGSLSLHEGEINVRCGQGDLHP